MSQAGQSTLGTRHRQLRLEQSTRRSSADGEGPGEEKRARWVRAGARGRAGSYPRLLQESVLLKAEASEPLALLSVSMADLASFTSACTCGARAATAVAIVVAEALPWTWATLPRNAARKKRSNT